MPNDPQPTEHPESTRDVLITAGPTHEPIDEVRYIANRSSGQMGIALAEEACRRGRTTTLLLGPTCRTPADHSLLTVVRFRTAEELQVLLADAWPAHSLLLMAAAVADFRLAGGPGSGKSRRTGEGLVLELEAVPDLLAGIGMAKRQDQAVIAFALEPEKDLLASAAAKLRRKGADAIVANPLETMDSEQVSATLLWASGELAKAPSSLPKTAFATWLWDHIQELGRK